MEAKMYAEVYNSHNPPKKVDFLDAYDRVLVCESVHQMLVEGALQIMSGKRNWAKLVFNPL